MSAPSVKLPMIGDVAWQAAFARRHALPPKPTFHGPGLTPVEIAIHGAMAAAKTHIDLGQSLLGADREAVEIHIAQAEKAQQLAEGWAAGTASYVPCLHRDFYEAGLEALERKGGAA